MKLIYALLIAFIFAACAPMDDDTTHTIQEGGGAPRTLYVWVDPAWSASDAGQILDELANLRPLGREFVRAPVVESAYLRVSPYMSESCDAWGRVDWVTRTAYVNSSCAPSLRAFRAVVGHELASLLGMRNVCRSFQEIASCSSVGNGAALMNALPVEELAPADRLPGEWQDMPTWLDVAEFERVQGQSSVHPY